MKIDNVQVYGLNESIVASGLPMKEDYNAEFFDLTVHVADRAIDFALGNFNTSELDDQLKKNEQLKRAKNLASCKGGESHDCFLCGIVVQFNMTAPRYFFPEFQRYHFADIISSTSTMHKLKSVVKKYAKADEIEQVDIISQHFSPLTSMSIAEVFMEFAVDNIDSIEEIKANLPEGWLQTARITTNYRQLKTIYRQRHDHPLNQWKDFCAWIETLPLAQQLLCVNGRG